MDKNEQKIYEHITKDATSKMDFNQIVNKVDYSQYKKEKKTFQFPKRLTLSLTYHNINIIITQYSSLSLTTVCVLKSVCLI